MTKYLPRILVLATVSSLGAVSFAQANKKPRVVKKPVVELVKPLATPIAEPMPEPTPEKAKLNQRPFAASPKSTANNHTPTHFFEFQRPGFLVSRILIEHNDNGKGKISFLKMGFDEMMSDPMELSPATIKGIVEALERMSFLDATENYQFERDMPQMGNNEFTLKRAERSRTVKYNWTTHTDAKFLIDEYRRIGNEYVWKFDLNSALENQPLQTPQLMGTLDSYIRRNEISDPPHLLPLLARLSNDERMPLIARNLAAKLLGQIQKKTK